jgi:hypothetical protein
VPETAAAAPDLNSGIPLPHGVAEATTRPKRLKPIGRDEKRKVLNHMVKHAVVSSEYVHEFRVKSWVTKEPGTPFYYIAYSKRNWDDPNYMYDIRTGKLWKIKRDGKFYKETSSVDPEYFEIGYSTIRG